MKKIWARLDAGKLTLDISINTVDIKMTDEARYLICAVAVS